MTTLDELTNDSPPERVAAAIISELKRRNYTYDEAIGVIADGLQESGLRMVWHRNRLWAGYFQQDSSYPNRENPAGNVRGFLDGLDVKRKSPAHGDIWANIFWLQQGPNWPSAEHALRVGRIGYLTEIKSQEARATALVKQYWDDDGAPTPVVVPVTNEGSTVPITGDPIWLENVLRKALGDRLVVEPGWKERGVGGTMGVIWGTMIHHTGNVNESVAVIRDGVNQAGSGWLQGPLAQILIKADGMVHLVAVGPCNHAGGGNYGTLTDGNDDAIGVECAYSGSGPWPQKQIISMRDVAAAISKHLGKSANDSVCGHKEYAKPQGRKPDPGNMDMNWFRAEVQKDVDGYVFPGEGTVPNPPVITPPPVVVPAPEALTQAIWDQTSARWEMLGWRTPVEALAAILDATLGVANSGTTGMTRGAHDITDRPKP